MPIKNPEIVSVKELMQEPLRIPNYQRPYKWSAESAVILFTDMYSAFCDNLPEYRIGSAVLHFENNSYNIVDGQQRLTTLSILLHCFSETTKNPKYVNSSRLLIAENIFGEQSAKSIIENHQILNHKCGELDGQKLTSFADYVLDNCTLVKIVTESEQEAFQFFDSQNSRGKALAPHDLLKSYHLREMHDDTEREKIKIITEWENTNQEKLALFFANNLYPLVNWYKKRDGLYYSTKKIKAFKGIKKNADFNFSAYHTAANYYIEQTKEKETSGNEQEHPQFQLTQPLIAGRRFFQYTMRYYSLYKKISELIDRTYDDVFVPKIGSGNKYVRNLFLNAALFFADRFNYESLTETRLKRLYAWCYSLRIVMHAVRIETINNYALGKSGRINNGINMFARIAEMQNPQELDLIALETVPQNKLEGYKTQNYQRIWEHIFGGKK